MAVSLLEQRLEPLEVRVPILFPLGPSNFPPSMESLEEEYGLDGVALAGRKLRRSHTWSGYASRQQRRDFQQPEETEAQPGVEAVRQEPQSRPQPRLPIAREARPVAGFGAAVEPAARELSPEDLQRSHSRSSSSFCSWASNDWASLLEEEEQEELQSRRSSLSTTASSSPLHSRTERLGKLGPDEAKDQEAQGQKQASRRKVQKKKKATTSPFHQPILTTFMVQNLARNTTRHRFLEALNALGFADLYDYVHVPTNFQTGRNQGFAFVNFVSVEVAQRFASQFQAADGTKPEDKLWRVAPADVQGSKANCTAARSGKMARGPSQLSRCVWSDTRVGSALITLGHHWAHLIPQLPAWVH